MDKLVHFLLRSAGILVEKLARAAFLASLSCYRCEIIFLESSTIARKELIFHTHTHTYFSPASINEGTPTAVTNMNKYFLIG